MLFPLLGVLCLAAAARGQCGGNLVDPSGDVSSPGYPSGYPSNLDCMWTVPARGGSATVTFKDFAIENPTTFLFFTSCDNDFVEILVGDSSEGYYCGTDMPPTITANSDIHIRFVTNDAISGTGFSFSYSVQYGLAGSACGTHLDAASGTAMSPNFPNDYPADLDCTWTIPASMYGTTVTFTDFTVEDAGFFSGCYDYVEIFTGADSVGKYCGTDLPPPVTSMKEIRIKFETDGSVQDQGFKFEYLRAGAQPSTVKPATTAPTTKPDGSGDGSGDGMMI